MNCLKAYEQELLKQTEPYLYYLNKMENKERGNAMSIEGPLPCVINITGVETVAFECFLEASSKSDTENKITYVIIKGPNVQLHEKDSMVQLLELGFQKAGKLKPDLIYSDNDYMTSDGVRHTPHFKPDYAIHTMAASNYIGELFAVKKEVLIMLLANGIKEEWNDSIWTLLIDLTRLCKTITHVTEMLWYISSDATSEEIYSEYADYYLRPSQLKIKDEALRFLGIFERNDYSVSIIIPSKDHSEILIRCLESIKNKTRFNQNKSNEIIIIDNGSYFTERQKIEEYIRTNCSMDIRYIYEPEEFNFSSMCNKGAAVAKGNLLLFLNDDVEAVSEDFIDHMARYALGDKSGAVGVRLMYPSGNKIQHIGISSLTCGPTHKLATFENDKTYYFGINRLTSNYLAVTGACLMVEREKFFKVNGFYDTMKVSYNDVDLCVKLYEAGLYNVVLPEDFLIHHESLSRGMDTDNSDKYKRLYAERNLFYERHPHILNQGDPFYNPNLICDTLEYRVNVMPDYEIRDRLSTTESVKLKGTTKAFHDRLKLNVERVDIVPSFNDFEAAYIEICGWTLYLKHDNRFYDRRLLLVPVDSSEIIAAEMMPVYRNDIGQVFAKESYTELCGFCVRISEALIKPDVKYRIGLMYEHKLWHTKVITYGDYYESGKLLQDTV